jgi:hypothetical protein
MGQSRVSRLHDDAGRHVGVGSWLCENALAEAPTTCDLGEAAVFGHRAVLAAFFVWNGS